MKITRRQLRRIIERIGGGRRYTEIPAHPRGDLGKNIADVEFPVVVGYEGQSEIAYNQEELDDILDDIAPSHGAGTGIKYSLNALQDLEVEDIPAGRDIEKYAEGRKPHDRSRRTRKEDSKKYRRVQGKEAIKHPEETEDTTVLGKGMLLKGPRMKTPSQLSYGLDYTGAGVDEMKITKQQFRSIVKGAAMRIMSEANDEDYQAVVENIMVKFYEKAHDYEQYQPLSFSELTDEELWVVEEFQPPEFKPIVVSSHPILELTDELQADVDDYTSTELSTYAESRSRLSEGKMTVQPVAYGGVSIEIDGTEKTVGDLVADLLDAGDDDIFQATAGKDLKSLDRLINAWSDNTGGDMLGWDSSVFSDYYNVDTDRVVRLYARRYNHQLEELEMEEW